MIIQAIIWLVIFIICGFIAYLGYIQWKKIAIKEKEEAVNEKLNLLDKEAKLAAKISVFTNEDSKENTEQIDTFLEKNKNVK